MSIAIVLLLFVLTSAAFGAALRNMPTIGTKDYLQKHSFLFFYYPLHRRLFKNHELQTLYFYHRLVKSTLIFAFALSTFLQADHVLVTIIAIVALILLEAFTEMICYKAFKKTLLISALFISFIFYLLLPVSYTVLKVQQLFLSRNPKTEGKDSKKIEELIEAIKSPSGNVDLSEQKLIASVLKLKEKKVREVMVPRTNLFCLPEEMSLSDAMKECAEEGYSRIPIYKENIDEITGILFIKDLLKTMAEGDEKNAQKTLKSIARKTLFTPETKKITQLLQEFRSKHTHMAVVVDEYGGTKGVLTIEDILEEIVGEIEDETDTDEEALFFSLPSGSFVIDSTMSIIDLEKQLKIKIPEEGDFDTIGGYIYHQSGLIPKKGYTIHTDEFDLEILSSSERKVEKIKLTPRKPQK